MASSQLSVTDVLVPSVNDVFVPNPPQAGSSMIRQGIPSREADAQIRIGAGSEGVAGQRIRQKAFWLEEAGLMIARVADLTTVQIPSEALRRKDRVREKVGMIR